MPISTVDKFKIFSRRFPQAVEFGIPGAHFGFPRMSLKLGEIDTRAACRENRVTWLSKLGCGEAVPEY
jgi:hypothetical protein